MKTPQNIYECKYLNCKYCTYNDKYPEILYTCLQRKIFQDRIERPKLILMRGLPGSGKSHLAYSLVGETGIIHSTDNKFYKNGKYELDTNKLPYYHFLNFMDSLKSMQAKISPIIIDNTNILSKHCRNYVDAAKVYGYEIIVKEVEIPWRFNIDELLKRNIHGVTRESLEKMIQEYEPLDLFKSKLGIK